MNLQRYCKLCGNQIPEARVKILPHTTVCVPCAEGTVTRKKAITYLDGQGDHAATTIAIVDENVAATIHAPEMRDIADTEPDQFLKDPKIPLNIKKRKDLA